MSVILAFDPGTTGAYALLHADGDLIVRDLPVLKVKRGKTVRSEIDLYELANQLRKIAAENTITMAVVERVGSMPGQGLSSTFGFGRTYGVIQGVIAALQMPMHLVTPVTWKRALRVPSEKDGARLRASEIFPQYSHHWSRVMDHNRAEAALLAHWFQRLP